MTLSTRPMTTPGSRLARIRQAEGVMSSYEKGPEPEFKPNAVTHYRTPLGNELSIAEIEEGLGLTIPEWQQKNADTVDLRTRCYIGGKAIGYVEFEDMHPHISLDATD